LSTLPDALRGSAAIVRTERGTLKFASRSRQNAITAAAATVSPRLVRKVVELNLLAPFYVAQAANARMQQQDSGGAIVNIGSVAARHAEPGSAAYSAAKAGLLRSGQPGRRINQTPAPAADCDDFPGVARLAGCWHGPGCVPGRGG
jgi:short chain dehydrogenase